MRCIHLLFPLLCCSPPLSFHFLPSSSSFFFLQPPPLLFPHILSLSFLPIARPAVLCCVCCSSEMNIWCVSVRHWARIWMLVSPASLTLPVLYSPVMLFLQLSQFFLSLLVSSTSPFPVSLPFLSFFYRSGSSIHQAQSEAPNWWKQHFSRLKLKHLLTFSSILKGLKWLIKLIRMD